MGLCENCKITMCRAERDDVIGCAEFVAKDTNVLTNADRVRAMSDKELANLLASKMANIKELEMAEKGIRVTATQLSVLASGLRNIWLQWLRQPAED